MKNHILCKLALAFCLLVLVSQVVIAQPGNRPSGQMKTLKMKLKGQIVDAATQQGLEFATISVFSSKDSSLLGGALSGEAGRFTVEIQPQACFAEVEFIGFEKLVISSINVDRKTLKENNFVLDLGPIEIQSAAILGEEITIQAERSETSFSLDKRVFNVGKDLSNRGGTAEDILDNVPSVTVDIEGGVSLRGSDGVRILINGQPSRMLGDANGLKNIPAEMIESVEVITNPSARYEAEGMAGIINIILKKEKRSGFNGSFNSSISYPLGGGLGANVNYRKNKINWFAGYNIGYRSNPGEGFLHQEIYGDTLRLSDQTRDMYRRGLSNTARGGMEYFFTEKQSLSGAIQYRVSDENNLTEILYQDFIFDDSQLINEVNRTDTEKEDEKGLQFNIDYNHEFSSREHKLKASLQFEQEGEVESSAFENRGSFATDNFEQRSINDEGQRNYLLNVDYVQPLGSKDHRFEVGVRSSVRNISNDYLVEEQEGNEWFSLPGLSNDFRYDENIQALYGQYANKHGKIGYQIGLRAEYASIQTVLINSDVKNNIDSLNFFPSAF